MTSIHYHGEAMECLEHAHELHYTESDIDCPLCSVNNNAAIIGFSTQHVELQLEFKTDFYSSIIIETPSFFHDFGRAPPSLT